MAQQGKVSDQIENLVADKLVLEAKWAILHSIFGEDDGVLRRCTADQSHIAQRLLVLYEAESPSRSDLVHVVVPHQIEFEALPSDHGMRKIDGICHRIVVAGIYTDELIALPHFDCPFDPPVGARSPQPAQVNPLDGLQKGQGAAIEDWEFQVIELDDGIVDPCSNERRENMLGRRDQHAFFQQAGGVAHTGDVATYGLNVEALKVGAAEADTRPSRGRQDAHSHWNATMQPYPLERYGFADCMFKDQGIFR